MEFQSANSEGRATGWNYCPAMQFFARFINVALIDCKCTLGVAPVSRGVLVAVPLPGADAKAVPSDEALLARDWIARSEDPADPSQRRYLSFPACCAQLGADVERSRVALLMAVDSAGDYDTDECWARLEELDARELEDDAEPLFDAPRVVPVVDQLRLF